MKSREDRTEREFSAARGARPGALGAPWQTESTGGAARETLQKCVVTHFEARGPKGREKPWRCAATGALGAF